MNDLSDFVDDLFADLIRELNEAGIKAQGFIIDFEPFETPRNRNKRNILEVVKRRRYYE